ncbi:MAG TPA: hypothetical protein VKB76_00490 [Ktedonobacterales bacterium]|nr:hypothetical protein [Ktedonobacterales bacterium]
MMRVRRSIWLLFAVIVGMALVVPLADLWYEFHQPIVSLVRFDPLRTEAGTPVRLVVQLQESSRAYAQHSTLQVSGNMVDMAMSLIPLDVPIGSENRQYEASLPLTMSGTWWVALQVVLPQRASWSQRVLVHIHTCGNITWRAT